MDYINKIYEGDAGEVLKDIPAGVVDLIVTSPPYADQRKKTYGGVHPNNYVEWFMPISEQLHRVLKDDGSFILNIKEKVVDGERHTYVLDLIKTLKEQGWRWTEEYMWHKKNSFPGKWPNRFRDAWERCLHFTKAKELNPEYGPARIQLGLSYYMKGLQLLAFEEWEKALKRNPGLKEAQTYLNILRKGDK